jgi:hypothetical protein
LCWMNVCILPVLASVLFLLYLDSEIDSSSFWFSVAY